MLCDKPCVICGSAETYKSENKCRPGTIDVQWSCPVCATTTHATIADPDAPAVTVPAVTAADAATDPTGLIEEAADDTLDTELDQGRMTTDGTTEPQASSLEPQD